MIYKEPQLAPTPVIVRYLAAFQRTYVAIEDYTRNGDKPGMLLGGWLADVLHNVPELLWSYDIDIWHNPQTMDTWMQEFPDLIAGIGAPSRLIEESRRILSAEGAAYELGVREDLVDLELAPQPKMREYLHMLLWVCLHMRRMTNYGSRRFHLPHARNNLRTALRELLTGQTHFRRSYTPWKGLERAWTDRTERQAIFNSQIASILKPLPQGLVRWTQFDDAQFVNATHESTAALPDDHQRKWRSFFDWYVSQDFDRFLLQDTVQPLD